MLSPRSAAASRWLMILTLCGLCTLLFLQVCPAAATENSATASAPAAPALQSPEDRYGLWTLTPALVAILVAVLLRQVLPALIMGIVTASAMVMFCLPPEARFGAEASILTALRLAVERYLVGALTDPSHSGAADPTRLQTVLASLTIAGMVGVIHANGGTAAFVARIARLATTRRRGQLATSTAGLLIFFDDYSNCLIIGPTMRPLLDRLRVSREKLAYLLDATAAPIASLAPFGTWIAAEVGFIQAGLDQLKGDGGPPAFLDGMTAYKAFLLSLPYRYYAIFAIILVFTIAITGRDFGPMRASERRVQENPEDAEASVKSDDGARWWHAGIPVFGLVLATMAILFLTGYYNAEEPRTLSSILSYANAYLAILYGAVIASTLAIATSILTRRQSLKSAMDSWLEGVQRVFPAIVILVLAWTLSDAMKDLHIGKVAVTQLQSHQFSPHLLPLLIFVSACIVSFATGTSWGTMGILCPVAVLLSGHMGAELAKPEALSLFYGTVGSVLAGAVFGDHCSPISDTTVLSALASNCGLEAHVWTQIPYALVAAAMEIVAGDLLCGWLGVPVWVGLIVGGVTMVLVVRVFGRTPDKVSMVTSD